MSGMQADTSEDAQPQGGSKAVLGLDPSWPVWATFAPG